MPDPDWNNLKVALAVARGGSLTQAARLLGLDQTTAGRRLTALETQLGTALFVRAKTGFVPTEDGRLVIERATRIEHEIVTLREGLDAPDGGASGVVRVLGNTWMLERLVETGLPELLDRHPRLELRFSGRLPPTPLYGETTLALWFDAAARPPQRARPFARVPYAVYRARGMSPPEDDWVQFRDDDATGPSFSREVLRRLGPSARVRMTGTDARILLGAVSSGVGHGALPTSVGDRCASVERADIDIGPMQRVLNLHMDPDAARTQRLRAVLDWIRRTVGPAIDATLLD